MTDAASNVVKLNIGGVRYETTSTTLCACGDNFFTRLLSSDLSSLRDDTGAYIIDRTGEYFAPILHFMRSGLLIIPDGMNVEALKGEAEFYLVTEFLAKLQELEEKQQKLAEEQREFKIRLVDKGCYVNESRGEAFIFYPNDKLTCVKIPSELRQQFSAYDQAIVVTCHQKTPTIWKEDQNLAGQFAQFFTSIVSKGHFKTEGQALRLSLANGDMQTGVARWKMATISGDSLSLLVQCDPQETPCVPFATYLFKNF